MRVAALEDNVAYLEQWCEEQQDTLDRAVGPVGCDYEVEPGPEPEEAPRALLRVVDLRDEPDDDLEDIDDTVFAVVETEHERRVRLIRAQLNRLRMRLATSLAPRGAPMSGSSTPGRPAVDGRPPAARPVSAKPAGRTAP